MTIEQKIMYAKDIIVLAYKGYTKPFLTFSGGKDSTVVLNLLSELGLLNTTQLVTIDTGYEYAETKQFIEEMERRFNLKIKAIAPSQEQSDVIEQTYAGQVTINGQYKCCKMKEPAMRDFLAGSPGDLWLTGLRSDETPERALVGILQQAGIDKLNPIIFWTEDDVWHYLKSNNMPYHSLYDQGYKSLGCKPCTEDGFREGRANQGKFEAVGTSLECGLHLNV